MQQDYDVLIVGGGLTGNSCALSLAGQGLRIAVIEAAMPQQLADSHFDSRAIALNHASCQLFSRLGLWTKMQAHATAIEQVHVSDRGHFGMARIHAKQQGVAALGYVIEMQHLLATLQHALTTTDVTHICPATVADIVQSEQGWQVHINKDEQSHVINTRLLVAADGSRSMLRDKLELKSEHTDYEQTAILTNVQLSRSHKHIAYERFCGPETIALLPMSQNRCKMVWTVAKTDAKALLELEDVKFLAKLQQHFGYRLGRLEKIGQRSSYPLHKLTAAQQTADNFVLLGNAAHTLHPVAAQGFNLSLQDISLLTELLISAKSSGDYVCALQTYQQQAAQHQERIIKFTDSLIHVFASEHLRIPRNIALIALDKLPAAKRRLAQLSMGKLARTQRLKNEVTS